VQEAIANCLPPLVPAIKTDASDLVRNLLSLLLDSENYGERRGAAYGLAGLIKGLGILALKQLDIMNTLTDAMQDKKNPKHREGAACPPAFCTAGAAFSKVPRKILGKFILGATDTQVTMSSRGYYYYEVRTHSTHTDRKTDEQTERE